LSEPAGSLKFGAVKMIADQPEGKGVQANTASASRSAISREPEWQRALDEVLTRSRLDGVQPPDLVLLFASYHHHRGFGELVRAATQTTGAGLLAGCSGQGIIGTASEIEAEPALAMLQLRFPGATLTAAHLTQDALRPLKDGPALAEFTGLPPAAVNAWLILADPFRMDVERLLTLMESGYPNKTLVGGLASGGPADRETCVFLNDEVFSEGAVTVSVGGSLTVRTVVSQGATPIGNPWTITAADGNVLETIAGRPAYDVLVETVEGLEDGVRERAARNLLVGLAMDEYRDAHSRGDFLIRNLVGVDRERGSIAVAAYPRPGQTVQFQMRDGAAADEELIVMLRQEQERLAGRAPAAALLCSCNGRGVGLFGTPNHDAQRVAESFGPLPLAGFFCNGEIGPVGGKPFLHGFTASLALFVPVDEPG
jgi:small ligand-binding sensory domain FIST